jgi:hypothetical protein
MHVGFLPEFRFNRCNILIRNAAGNDVPEVRKIGIHIERYAVHGNPAAAADAHSAYFTRPAGDSGIEPHTCFTGASARI